MSTLPQAGRVRDGLAALVPSRPALVGLLQGRALAVAFLLTAIVEGILASVLPPVGIGLAAVTVATAAIVATRTTLSSLFLVCLAGLLAGFMFLGRGLAHVGVGPVYVGDVVLLIGVPATLSVVAARARFDWLHGLLGLYVVLGALRTVPYLSTYGLDALRDAATWLYAFFAVAVSVIVLPRHLERITTWYRRILPAFLLWVPVAYWLDQQGIPPLPGSDVAAVVFKGGDMGVHLAGAAAFILLGLATTPGAGAVLRQAFLWVIWLADLLVVGAVNRGGLLAASVVVAAAAFERATQRWLVLVLVVLGLVSGAALANPTVETAGAREISVSQIVDNVRSIFDPTVGTGSLQASKDFRLEWWGQIVSYTFEGPYFWTGKGFGINLADDDGFQTDGTLRAPHDSHMNILAREGVPGLVLWLLLQVAFGWRLLQAGLRAHADGRRHLAQVSGWLFVYWLAALVNMSFDVYLEGPQGGIWFWVVFGLGLAVMRAEVVTRPGRTAKGATEVALRAGATA